MQLDEVPTELAFKTDGYGSLMVHRWCGRADGQRGCLQLGRKVGLRTDGRPLDGLTGFGQADGRTDVMRSWNADDEDERWKTPAPV